MMPPDHLGFNEYTPQEIGEHFAGLIESAIADRDRLIEIKERENELLRQRIEELSNDTRRAA